MWTKYRIWPVINDNGRDPHYHPFKKVSNKMERLAKLNRQRRTYGVNKSNVRISINVKSQVSVLMKITVCELAATP
jgi:hypothetical protein